MANWAGRLDQSTNFADVGLGQQLAPELLPKYESVLYANWRDGMDLSASPEDLGPSSAVDITDIVVDRRGGVGRAPGIVQVENVNPRQLRWLFQQATLDNSTELVAIDAPYLGYKGHGDFIFVDAGIAEPGQYGWNAVNVNGVLVFSDGSSATYARQPAAAVVENISDQIVARTFANFAGRTFAGNYSDPISGIQNLGVRWNGTSSDYDDWDGDGSGAELLISNSLEADRVVAMRTIGFDVLGILCRHSLWLGYETDIANRPADFKIRRVNVGCVAEACAASMPDGIAFLHDDGLYIYNQNVCQMLSAQINDELLPLDFDNIDQYKVLYLPELAAALLKTPTLTYVYEFPRPDCPNGRWTKRSFSYDNIVLFADQSAILTWDTITGTWDDQTLTWNEMQGSESNVSPTLFIGSASILGKELIGEETYLGVEMTPLVETAQRNQKVEDDQEEVSIQATTMGFEVEYKSDEDATVQFVLPNSDGYFTQVVEKILTSSGSLLRRGVFWLPSPVTGQGLKVLFKIKDGNVHLYRLRQIYVQAGPAVSALDIPAVQL